MKYRVTNVPHVVPVECTWQDEKVFHSLPPNIPELIGHVVRVFLDNSHKICLNLNHMWLRPSDYGIPMHSVDPTGKSSCLVLMVCGSRVAMNSVLSVLTKLVATKSDKLISLLW